MNVRDFHNQWMIAIDDYKYGVKNSASKEEIEELKEFSHRAQVEYVESVAAFQKANPGLKLEDYLQGKDMPTEKVGVVRRALGIDDPLRRVSYLVVEVEGYRGSSNYIYLQFKLRNAITGEIGYTVTDRAIGTHNDALPIDWNNISAESPVLASRGHGPKTGAFFEQIASNTVIRFVIELDERADVDFVDITPHENWSTPKSVNVYKTNDPMLGEHSQLCVKGCIHDGTVGCISWDENEYGVLKTIEVI